MRVLWPLCYCFRVGYRTTYRSSDTVSLYFPYRPWEHSEPIHLLNQQSFLFYVCNDFTSCACSLCFYRTSRANELHCFQTVLLCVWWQATSTKVCARALLWMKDMYTIIFCCLMIMYCCSNPLDSDEWRATWLQHLANQFGRFASSQGHGDEQAVPIGAYYTAAAM